MKLKVKKGSTVKVLTGADKGKTGAVLEVDAGKMRVKVQGVRVQTKVDKKENQLIKTEGFIHYSNVALLDSAKKSTASKKKASSKSSKKSSQA